jgi:hypothetical protein
VFLSVHEIFKKIHVKCSYAQFKMVHNELVFHAKCTKTCVQATVISDISLGYTSKISSSNEKREGEKGRVKKPSREGGSKGVGGSERLETQRNEDCQIF